MNETAIQQLIHCLGKEAVGLMDAMSVVADLVDVRDRAGSEGDMIESVLQILLQSQKIEAATVFMRNDTHCQLIATARWDRTSISVEHHAQDKSIVYHHPADSLERNALKSGHVEYDPHAAYPAYLQQDENAELASEVISAGGRNGSLMCIPFMSNDQAIGVLSVFNTGHDCFQNSHEQFLSLFARLFVQLLMNYRYTHHLKTVVDEKTHELQELLKTSEKLQHDYRELSQLDEQTGLPNRRFFCTEARAVLASNKRHGRDFSCCLIEISNFSELVKQHGLFAGDRLLMAVADILKMQVREGDLLAHFRGEQFVIALPETDAEGARQFSDRMLQVLADSRQSMPALLSDMQLHTGLAGLTADMNDSGEVLLDQLMALAGEALQAGKQQGVQVMHHDELLEVPSSGLSGAS